MIDLIGELRQAAQLQQGLQRQNPLFLFFEPWMDEVIPINPNFWATVVTGTGTVTRDATEAGVLKVNLDAPALADTARLRSISRWRCDPANFRTNSLVRKFHWRFRAVRTVTFTQDPSGVIIGGLTPGIGDTSASANIVAFSSAAAIGILTITDVGGARTTNTLAVPGWANVQWCLFEIEIYADGAVNYVRFTVTDAAGNQYRAIHTTNIPVQNMYLQHFCVSAIPWVAPSFSIGELSAAYYDNVLV